jgi:mRNA interferase MazF
MRMIMKRGDLCWAELKPRSGSEQTGRQPVVIISNNGFNEVPNWRSVIVIPVTTSSRQSLRGPTVVSLSGVGSVLSQNSAAVCHQITTLDRSMIDTRIGALSRVEMEGIEEGIRAACDLV